MGTSQSLKLKTTPNWASAKRAMSTIRISLSHLTTTDEINKFLNSFKLVYHNYLE